MSARPLLLPLCALIIGLCSAYFEIGPLSPVPLVILFLLGLVTTRLRSPYPFLFIFVLFLAGWGNLSIRQRLAPVHHDQGIARFAGPAPVFVEGVVAGRPDRTSDGFRFLLDVEGAGHGVRVSPASGRLLIYVKGERAELCSGDRIRCAARIRLPRPYGIPGEFDQERQYVLRGIAARGFVTDATWLTQLGDSGHYPLQRGLDKVARRVGTLIEEQVPAPEAGIVRALLLGDRGAVDPSLEDAYARVGVNHILSISGFHVGVVAMVIVTSFAAVARFSRWLLLAVSVRRMAILLTLPLLVLYLLLTGAAPATVRSVIMLAACAMTLVLEREVDPLNYLLLAATAILFWSPEALFEISFQLSFLAMWGLIVLTPLIMKPFDRVPQIAARRIIQVAAASTAATVATLLPVAYHFHRVSFIGIVSNLLVAPLIGYGAVVVGFIAIPLVFFIPSVAGLLMAAAGVLVAVGNWLVDYLAKVPPWHGLNPDRTDLLLFLVGVALWSFFTSDRTRLVSGNVLAAAALLHHLATIDPDAGKLRLSFLSVGQGEATLVELPDGQTMLIDAGGTAREGGSDTGRRLLAPALLSMGISRIDRLVLTHPHPDHLQGMHYLADTFKVGEFWESGETGGPDHHALRETLARRGVSLRRVDGATPPFNFAGVRIEPLAPFPVTVEGTGQDLNDRSLAFRLRCGEFTVLFTGDIGIKVEESIGRDPGRVRCRVLKVAHHGSRHSNSPAFLAAASPEVAVISAGYGNAMGLPAPETVAELRRRNITVYRTDLDGTVVAVYDPQSGSLTLRTPFRPRH